MDVSHFIFSQHMNWILSFFSFFFFPFLERGEPEPMSVMSGVVVATKTLLPWRTDICCLSKVAYE